MSSTRLYAGIIALIAIAPAANAGITFNVEQADIVFNTGQTEALSYTVSGSKIDFTAPTTAGSLPLTVGDGAYAGGGRSNASLVILYTATSTTAVTSLNLTFAGTVFNEAAVSYSEYVESADGSSTLGSVSGIVTGAGLGGSNGAFVQNNTIDFSSAATSFKVKKSFDLIDLDSAPSSSYASIGYIEQNAVPEPASLGALGIGVVALFARRRRK